MAKKKKRSFARIYIIILSIGVLIYILFYAYQTQQVYQLEKANKAKEDRITQLNRELAENQKKRTITLSLEKVKTYAEEVLKMRIAGPKERDYLPDPRSPIKGAK